MKINLKAIPEALKVVGKVLEKNKSTILVGAGLAGWIGTTVLVAKAAPKAKTAIVQEERRKAESIGSEEYSDEDHPAPNIRTCVMVDLSPIEKFKVTWQYYIPAVGLGFVSSAAIVYAHKLDLAKITSLLSTYQLTKGELKTLKDKIVEKDGEEKLKEYQKETHEDRLQKVDKEHILDTGKGTTIFYEPLTDTLFYSDIWHVEKALIRMVEQCTRNDGMCSLDELLDDLDLPTTPLTADYAFFRDGVGDISCDRVHDLFEYHSVDAEHGDARPCIWLDIKERVANLRIYEDGGSFRRPLY